MAIHPLHGWFWIPQPVKRVAVDWIAWMRTPSFDVLPLSYISYGVQPQVRPLHRRAVAQVILDAHAHLSVERKRLMICKSRDAGRRVHLIQCTYIVDVERDVHQIALPNHSMFVSNPVLTLVICSRFASSSLQVMRVSYVCSLLFLIITSSF